MEKILELCSAFDKLAAFEDDPEFYEGLTEIIAPEEPSWEEAHEQGAQRVTELKSNLGFESGVARSEREKTRRTERKTERAAEEAQEEYAEDPEGFTLAQTEAQLEKYEDIIRGVKELLVSGNDGAVVMTALEQFSSPEDLAYAKAKLGKKAEQFAAKGKAWQAKSIEKTLEFGNEQSIISAAFRLSAARQRTEEESAFTERLLGKTKAKSWPDPADVVYAKAKLRNKVKALGKLVSGLKADVRERVAHARVFALTALART